MSPCLLPHGPSRNRKISALQRVLVYEHLHLPLQGHPYGGRVDQLETGAVDLQVHLRRFEADRYLAVGWTDQSPAAAGLEYSDLEFAVVDAAALQLHPLETVDVAEHQRHYAALALLLPQLFCHLLLIPLLVLENHRYDARARLQRGLADTAESFQAFDVECKLVHKRSFLLLSAGLVAGDELRVVSDGHV